MEMPDSEAEVTAAEALFDQVRHGGVKFLRTR